jgi:glycosyltransferase involved in cell wall biosynthesis
MTKLIVQIPCLNEAQTLPATLADLPAQIEGVDRIEVLIIDDGSTDNTCRVAQACGVDHLVRFPQHRGLAKGFAAGLDACLRLGADVIVHTDADGQYPGEDIPKLVAPILRGEADIVIGDRGVGAVEHFSPGKRLLQGLGSRVVSKLSGIKVGDVTSGFRAYSREAALRLNILSDFTYTLDSLIQSGSKPIAVMTVPTRSNAPTRPSRLFKGIPEYIRRQVPSILRLYMVYQPMRTLSLVSALFLLPGLLIGVRFLTFFFAGLGAGHIQSLILATIMLIVGVQILVLGLVADLMATNRRLLEDTLYRVRRLELRQEPELPSCTRSDAVHEQTSE